MSDGDRKSIELTQQYLANERTFLAWIRTSIALIGLGFVVARFGLFLREFQVVIQQGNRESTFVAGGLFSEYSFSSLLGVVMISLGVALIIYSLKSYRDGNKQIEEQRYTPKKHLVYISAIMLAIFEGVTVAYLLIISLL